MRIAQVSPLWERVPPPGYGGIELVVSQLTDELVRRGHDVTLFASGDSITKAKLKSVAPQALRLDPSVEAPIVYELLQLAQIGEVADEFDLIHFHTGMITFPVIDMYKTPVVHTMHGRFGHDISKAYARYSHIPHISISNHQRSSGPEMNYVATVYNGVKIEDYPFNPKPADDPPYLGFLGRLSKEKGPHHAIRIARETGWNLKMAGKVDVVDREFFEQEIAPEIDGKQIQYLGEVSHEEKVELLSKASLTVFPITWPEPFGLVMIESMCVGTPVIATNFGSVPEVVADKRTGIICANVEDINAAIPEALKLSREECRKYVEETFSVPKMVDGYEAAFQKVIEQHMSANGTTSAPVSAV
ncbi:MULTISPECIES: glycosyltransferase family 4 protein [Moorena]|uniref:Glycosyltransferase n=1 Tax=Moorena producens 3L TaxID=489825 RepID=F4XTM7_9CYAN|nr:MULTISPECIES: glycosyltransferase family 4 protein [Moorena]EGJ31853.1 glycosyltransferase [Moorena producens 3L]NEP32452.1 glycosyltransferase family 4 protein [Moorena sp. SIO3B2]NEP68188.1 glycosyltransferase family 4 protein [Moorena sp. SIO3A5]NEQ06269.1 glycosyltransferase family 4 protein [Moorena sp. SIO4E2]NER89241.1 glycosyltransferase family 4 protein [Moorena sp. SIO3A2]